MNLNRSPQVARRSTWLVAMIIGVLASVLSAAPSLAQAPAPDAPTSHGTAPRVAANPFGCHTKIDYFGNEIGTGNRIELKFTVTCSQTVDEIRVAAAIQNLTRGGAEVRDERHPACTHTNYCTVTIFHPNPSGKQDWSGRGLDCTSDTSCTTQARVGGTASEANTWPCPPQATCVGNSGLEIKYLYDK
jgi:hypothetical protein